MANPNADIDKVLKYWLCQLASTTQEKTTQTEHMKKLKHNENKGN